MGNSSYRAPETGPFQLENVSAFISTFPGMGLGVDDLIERLAETLVEVTSGKTLLIRLQPASPGEPSRDWSPLHSLPFNSFAFAGQLQSLPGGVNRLFLRVNGESADRKYLNAFLGHCSRFFAHVLVQMEPEVGRGPMTECVRRARLAYALVRQSDTSYARFREYNGWLKKSGKARRVYLKPALCLSAGELAQTQEDIHRAIGATIHIYLRDCPEDDQTTRLRLGCDWPGGFCFDLRRLAREIGRCRIGLALSSGGAKGFAYVGVIQALEKHGIEVDAIAGCSMGAYIGALWAYGYDSKYILHKALELHGRWGLWKLIDPVFPPRRGFIRGEKIKNMLKASIGDAQFCDLLRPLKVVAANLETLESRVFDTGDVATAVQASAAIPGVCVPVEIDGETYVDGGVVNPLPVNLLRQQGIEKVIAVNTIPTPALMRCARERAREQVARYRAKPWWKRLLNRQLNYFAAGNILDIIQQSFIGAQIPNAEEACRHADVVLRPINFDGTWHDFNRPRKYIALGRRVTLEHLDELKALTKPNMVHHEYETINHAMATAA